MRKVPPEEVAAAARRRLELLGRELDQAGLTRLDDAQAADALAPPTAVLPAGRHAAEPRESSTGRARAALGELVPDTLRGRVSLDRGALLVVLVLAVLGVGVAAVAVGRQQPVSGPVSSAGEEPAPADPLATGLATPQEPGQDPGQDPGTASAATGPAAGTPARVVVHVAGKVRRPGVLELPSGARVADAIERAGGARRGVALSGLNLARVLVDGEQVWVGRVEAGSASGPAATASDAAPPTTGSLVSLNSGTLDQLDTIPGVGPVTAQKILDWRAAHGAFSSVDELLEIDGIGDATLAEIAPHVTL